jgi:hypothetical protein
MMTPAQGRAQRRQLMREISRDERLRELEAKERAAHKALKRPLARARAGAAALDEAVPF